MIINNFVDALTDSLKLLPFLYVIYLIIEYVEHIAGEKMEKIIRKTDSFGPFFGGLLGVIPQCGFSAGAATLYTEGLISTGTVLAVFLSTSDEMLPLLLTESVSALTIVKILGAKCLIGVITGYAIDLILKLIFKKKHEIGEIHPENHQHEMNLFLAALLHSLEVFAYLLIFAFLINLGISLIGEDVLTKVLSGHPLISLLVSSVVGLIPNCASSVLITKLYLSGLLSSGSMLGGLLVNAGVGTLVLLKNHVSRKHSFLVIGLLFISGFLWGLLFTLLNINF